jgi:hypothetical protein
VGLFLWRTSLLAASVVIDYQNLHMTGWKLHAKNLPRHQHYIDPISFAESLAKMRNSRMAEEFSPISIESVLVYRGIPSNIYDPRQYSRNLAQASHWQRDNRVVVTHRPLKYEFERNESGLLAFDNQGKKIPISRKEKGIDVLCALALVREIRKADVVILASQDTDLIPAIDEAHQLNMGKVETCSWYLKKDFGSREIRSEKFKVWNTRLGEEIFQNSLDKNIYSQD